MFRLYAGAQVERPPGTKYVASLPFAELVFGASRPKTKTLAKWRATVPESFQTAIVAPKNTLVSSSGPYREGEDLDAGIAWLQAAREATGAHLILPTYGLTTSKRDRARLAAVIAQFREGPGHLIWAPGGLWEDELAHDAAEELDVVCAYDPLEDDFPGGPIAYARLPALGVRQRFSEGVLEDVLDSLADTGAEEAFVAIESPRSFREATNLLRIATGS